MGFLPMLQFAILVVLISFQSIYGGVESGTLSIVTDKEALISFKHLMSTESSNSLPSWNKYASPCNWTGVLCNEFRQRVISLDLSGLGLTGTVSPHIGNLSYLRSLQLQNNHFTGTLPDQIGYLFRLRVLNMSSNSIEGAIPPNISGCTNLQKLDLTVNKITGRIPQELSHLPKLQVLKLGGNNLSGPIPQSIANLSSLITLNFRTNSLSGMIPDDLARLQNLKQLDLTSNKFTGIVPPSLYNMSSLVSLALASNQLHGKIPSDIGDKLPNILDFRICFNQFTGSIPASLHNVTKIQVIRMSYNFLDGSLPPGLENLPNLTMYNIGYNRIVSSGNDGLSFITSLTNSTHLNYLAFDGNLLEGVIPESIGNLSKDLTKLYMGENRIYGTIPTSIGRLSSLILLNLHNNSISGEIPEEIGHLEELQMLYLAGNRISGGIPNSLGNLQNLYHLDLSGNELSGRVPATFENFLKLGSLDLSNNRLNGSIPQEILSLPSLSTLLNLSNNFLSGPLPQEVGILQSVVRIDLSNNRLSRTIPDSIGNCKNLEGLFMAKNMLSGRIPDSLGGVRALCTLDLSSNQLSGPIPADLQNLNALQLLNLSFNNLEGQVPSGGVFGNVSRFHLEGNPKLCMYLAPCEKSHGHHGRRLVSVVIIITTVAIVLVALFVVIGLLFYVRKSKPKTMPISESVKGQHQMVSYDELRVATGNFKQENLVGNGSFGSVYKGFLREGIAVAVKVLNMESTGYWRSFLAECEALKNVRHRNLVKLITSCSSIDFKNMEFLALVYEFMSNGSLEDWVKGARRRANGEGLNVVQRLNVAIDVACAISYLHHDCEAPVVHCDLKPSNVLLDEDMTSKVGDFGLARLLVEGSGDQPSISSTQGLKGSIGYIPPEYGLGGKPSTAGDVYSYGVMLLELFTGKSPTHETFAGKVSLTKWVVSNFPSNAMRVLDPKLLLMANLRQNGQPINLEIQHDCMITVIGVGLSCTVDSPYGRISMRDAFGKLKTARDTLLKPTPR